MVSEFLLIDYIDFFHLYFLSIIVGDEMSHVGGKKKEINFQSVFT
jgi:hypothetical protein